MNAELPIALVEPRDFTVALGGLVRALRQRADWTQPELASRSFRPGAPKPARIRHRRVAP